MATEMDFTNPVDLHAFITRLYKEQQEVAIQLQDLVKEGRRGTSEYCVLDSRDDYLRNAIRNTKELLDRYFEGQAESASDHDQGYEADDDEEREHPSDCPCQDCHPDAEVVDEHPSECQCSTCFPQDWQPIPAPNPYTLFCKVVDENGVFDLPPLVYGWGGESFEDECLPPGDFRGPLSPPFKWVTLKDGRVGIHCPQIRDYLQDLVPRLKGNRLPPLVYEETEFSTNQEAIEPPNLPPLLRLLSTCRWVRLKDGRIAAYVPPEQRAKHYNAFCVSGSRAILRPPPMHCTIIEE